ncbi:hypothetical protein SLS54_006418 [Diplodia seriata]
MPDEVLPDAPMAVIPGANGGMLDFLSPKSTFPQEDEEASAPSSEPRSQQASTFEYLSDAQFDAMLVANSATPPPFETVNPSALSSPGPATDFSSSDDGMAMQNPSPFQPANYQFFDTDGIRSTPFTTNIPPLSAPIARRYSRHLSLHDGAHTEPHASPVGFPLQEQSPEPPADQPPGMKRLEKRNKNFAVTELDGQLEPLPRSMQLETGLEDVPWDVPPNAQGIRNLDHDGITPLLEAYGIPFQPDMFLGQKKELYLRFIGANRTLMHRVLD